MKFISTPGSAPRHWLALYCVMLGLVAGCHLSAMTRGEVPALRDAFQFYYPLEVWLDAQRTSGNWLPQFNPLDGTGVNLIGETSSALFYPGRFLWWLPALSVAQRLFVVYVVHIVIAAGGAAYAARRMALGRQAAALAATAYALSAPVFFQHINPIYLIGAAWAPWALAECWVLAYHPSSVGGEPVQPAHSAGPLKNDGPRTWVWVVACSMMLLGGDPQSTAGAGIVATAAVIVRAARVRRCSDALQHGVWLLRATAIVIGLTSIQWVPAGHWYWHSQRVVSHDLQGDATAMLAGDVPTLLRPLSESTDLTTKPHLPSTRYAFSIAPWHLLTLAWGTAGGHYLPDNSRWLQACAAEPRMWVPSLSIGLAPILLVIANWFSPGARRSPTFLVVVVLLACAAMLGNYAPVWALRQVCRWCGAAGWASGLPSDEVGGVYWFFTQIVPGYSAFRYPGKWSVWFACGLALWAAHALDRLPELRQWLHRLGVSIALVSAVGMLSVCWMLWQPGQSAIAALTAWLASAELDPWLGRPNTNAVVRVWLSALAVGLGTATGCCLVARSKASLGKLQCGVVMLTLLELSYGASVWTVTVDPPAASQSMQFRPLSDRLQVDPLNRVWANTGRARIESHSLAVAETTPQPAVAQRRVEELVNYQTAFQLGKLHLLTQGRGNLAAMHSLTPHSLAAVRHRLAQADTLLAVNPRLDEALAWLGVSQRLTLTDELQWQSVPQARQIAELVAHEGKDPAGTLHPAGTLQLENFRANHLRLRVACASPAILGVRLLQDGGWSARLTAVEPGTRAVASHSVKPRSSHLGLFQTMLVPQGDWIVELSYESPGLRLGAIVSSVTLLLFLIHVVVKFYVSERKHSVTA